MPITTLDAPCFVIATEPDGKHWASLDDAPTGPHIARLPAPCLVASCDADCGEPMGDDDLYTQVHFDRREDLTLFADTQGWTVTEDGRVLCAEDQ